MIIFTADLKFYMRKLQKKKKGKGVMIINLGCALVEGLHIIHCILWFGTCILMLDINWLFMVCVQMLQYYIVVSRQDSCMMIYLSCYIIR